MNTAGFAKTIANALLTAAAGRVTIVLKTEFENAKEEVRVKAKSLAIGLALVGVGAALLYVAFWLLVLAAVAGLHVVWPLWLSALVLGGGLALITSILIAVGVAKVRKNGNLMPSKSIARAKKVLGK